MKKWYRSAAFKGVLTVFEYIFIITALLCMGWVTLLWPRDIRLDVVLEKPGASYEDSSAFEADMLNFVEEVTDTAIILENFETEGEYNEEKLVDIIEYVEHGTISGNNTSGLTYRLRDLLTWSDHFAVSEERAILVCQKPDGKYVYYFENDFLNMLEEENFNWKEGQYDQGIYDKDGNIVFSKCWTYDGYYVDQFCAPEGYSSIIEFINLNDVYNGKLSEIMADLSWAIENINNQYVRVSELEREWTEGNTNAVYYIRNLKTNKTYTNRSALKKDFSKAITWIESQKKFAVVPPKRADFTSNMEISASRWEQVIGQRIYNPDDYIFAYALDTDFPIQDNFYNKAQQYNSWSPVIRIVFIVGSVMILLAIIDLFLMTLISGRSNKMEEIRLFWFDRIKTEIFIGIFLAAGYMVFKFLLGRRDWILGVTISLLDASVLIVIGGFILCSISMILWFSITRRIKAGTLWSNSIIGFICNSFKLIVDNMSSLRKTVIIFLLLLIMHVFGFLAYTRQTTVVILLIDVILCLLAIRTSASIQKLKKGVIAISEGKVDYQIPLDGLKGEHKEMARNINDIGSGLDKALQESIKNERMKTDLITNVSHDIKTPLTSIINYIGLLKMENFTDPKVQNYLQILDEKSQRLKILTEDVVEASKLSSGNVKLENINLDFGELVKQACAELEEKFEERDLELIVSIPEEAVLIYADGRRMWRVLSNLLVNAAKYALSHTRVYVDIKVQDEKAYFIIKNISEQALNISPEELTERFIRGDDSRSTQGSGLGLSIARSLTELQGGTMTLHLDGDLFKVELCFSKIKANEETGQ